MTAPPDPAEAATHRALPCVTICRGCCCGSSRKHPDVDHDEQVRRLRRELGCGVVRVSPECLGHCENSNLMVVLPSRLGRLFGGRPTWIGQVLDEQMLTALAGWITAAGPGLAAMPAELQAAVFVPPRPGSP